MKLDELREATLQVIWQTYEETGRSSSSKILFKKVEGLNNRNFYKIFESVEEAHKLAGVPYDKSLKKKMQTVRKKIGKKSIKSAKSVKKVDNSSTLELMDPSASVPLSKDIKKIHFALQGILGTDSIIKALETAYRDEVSAAKYKTTLWETYSNGEDEFSFGALVEKILENFKELEEEYTLCRGFLKSLMETKAKLEDLVEKKYDEGYQKGVDDHAILVPCTSCNEPITILPGTKVHQILVDYHRDSIICSDCIHRDTSESMSGRRFKN